jgi:adenine-specific DNA-methyltransferase
MNYIGSKYSLLPFLEKNILGFAGPQTERILFDIFAGTGAVGQHFKRLGFRIVANDIQYYSYCLNRAYVGINREPGFAGITSDLPRPAGRLLYDSIDVVLDYLNRLEGVEGFVYRSYCPGGTAGTEFPRQYYTDENGKRCDAIRLQVERWRKNEQISEDEYFYLLASLIEAVDKVANTASVYGAFLKHIKRSARKPLRLRRLQVVPSREQHQVYNRDGDSLVSGISCDILYVDPPYNQRQYCTNYHVLETIARYDSPDLYGVTGLREYEDQKSDFCYADTAVGTLESLIQRTQARFVFLSYNSEGLMPEDEIITAMERYGRVELRKQEYRRFRADIDRENRKYKADKVVEYLFCLEKTPRV